MKKMTDLALQRGTLQETVLTAPWTPVTELVVEVAGAKLSVTWTTQGPVYRFTGDILPAVTERDSAPFEAHFNIYGWDGVHTQADLVNSLDFMKGTMQDPQKQWVEVQRLVGELPGFQERLVD